jgi:hypothetical protein
VEADFPAAVQMCIELPSYCRQAITQAKEAGAPFEHHGDFSALFAARPGTPLFWAMG